MVEVLHIGADLPIVLSKYMCTSLPPIKMRQFIPQTRVGQLFYTWGPNRSIAKLPRAGKACEKNCVSWNLLKWYQSIFALLII